MPKLLSSLVSLELDDAKIVEFFPVSKEKASPTRDIAIRAFLANAQILKSCAKSYAATFPWRFARTRKVCIPNYDQACAACSLISDS